MDEVDVMCTAQGSVRWIESGFSFVSITDFLCPDSSASRSDDAAHSLGSEAGLNLPDPKTIAASNRLNDYLTEFIEKVSCRDCVLFSSADCMQEEGVIDYLLCVTYFRPHN
jgi:hypothetical protein